MGEGGRATGAVGLHDKKLGGSAESARETRGGGKPDHLGFRGSREGSQGSQDVRVRPPDTAQRPRLFWGP